MKRGSFSFLPLVVAVATAGWLVGSISLRLPPATIAVPAAAALGGVLARHPRTALSTWLVVVALIPHWLGFVVGGIYFSPTTLAAILLAPAIVVHRTRLRSVDVYLLGVLVLATIVFLADAGSQSALSEMILIWATAYAIGRTLAPAAGLDFVGRSLAIILAAVGIFAVVEFQFDWHPFDAILGPSDGQNAWAGLIDRGGHVRSEAAFGHPIALGGALALGLAFALDNLKRGRWVAVAALALGTAASFSRGPLASLALTLALWAWAGPRARVSSRLVVLAMVGVAAYLTVPTLLDVTTNDANVAASNNYRATVLFPLFANLRPFGFAEGAVPQDGIVLFNGYSSVDNALLSVGLSFGWVLTVLLALPWVASIVRVVRRNASTADIALAGQLPVLLTAAFITQYAAVLWFVAGIAVTSAYRARSRGTLSEDVAASPVVAKSTARMEKWQGNRNLGLKAD